MMWCNNAMVVHTCADHSLLPHPLSLFLSLSLLTHQDQFHEYPELLRMAVSLGRRMQEPLHEFTSLMRSEDNEMLALRMHPLQDCLPKDQLLSSLEVELVTKVNDVGVDVNFCLEHLHAEDMVPFVCGLGPRKAAALMKVASLIEWVECVYRRDL